MRTSRPFLLLAAGLLALLVAGCFPHQPELEAELATDVAIAEVPESTNATTTVVLSNIGNGSSGPIDFELTGAFTLDQTCANQDGSWLGPGGSCELLLGSGGALAGNQGTLTITAENGVAPLVLTLVVVPGEPILSTPLPDVLVSPSGSVGVAIYNEGTADAVIASVAVSPGYSVNDGCTGDTIEPGLADSCLLGVTVAANGPATGTLTVTAVGGSVVQLNLIKAS